MDKSDIRLIEHAVGCGLVKLPGNWGNMTAEEEASFISNTRIAVRTSNDEVPAEVIDWKTRPHGCLVRERERICHHCDYFVCGRCAKLNPATEDIYNRIKQSNGNLCPLKKWLVEFLPVEGEIESLTCNSDKLVATIGVNKYGKELLEYTQPLMEQYAEKCGADFWCMDNQTQVWWMLEKFRLHKIFDRYKKVLFVDADVILTSRAPDLFKFVPDGKVAFHDDYPYLEEPSWLDEEYRIMSLYQGIEDFNYKVCYNAGLIVADSSCPDLWRPPPHPFPPSHCMEQIWVDHTARTNYEIFELPVSLNCQWWMKDFWSILPTAKIIHLAACDHDTRIKLLKKMSKW